MKNATTKRFELMLRAAFIAVLALSAYKCTAQDFRVQTAVGLVVCCDSPNPDEICLSFGLNAGELTVKHLGKTSTTLPGRIAAAARMADEAGVDYRTFLIENGHTHSAVIRGYYTNCRELRRQFLSLMPERAFNELRAATQHFK